ncbi:AAA family ATPase [Paraneptunicella aestuarii]|uniref:KAP family P-loop NTPase fold protein n=1 Tax=Paraneptunicella aestuarii TaxID=2831148 RepID=UPI001E2A864F|nr:P-loop NTPase fold protein [Paraneptunicella aestuarii]UAA37696.1 AAA family ATPase [Paraneptunicella aestuarii]
MASLSFLEVNFIQDKPTKEDLTAELCGFAENLHELITSEAKSQNPAFHSILISGDWGSGKTSVLRRLESLLSQEQDGTDNSEIVPIFFEAWKHESESNLMTSLLWTLVHHSKHWQDIANENSDIAETFKTSYRYTIQLLTKRVTGSNLKDVHENADYLQHLQLQAETSPNLPPKTDTHRFQIAFKQLISKLFDNKNIVIIVDDLDRCSPESAMLLLDNMRILMNAVDDNSPQASLGSTEANEKLPGTKCTFIVAMDKTVLKQAINHKFSALSSYDSHRYLEKLFPLSLNIPVTAPQIAETTVGEHQAGIDKIFSKPYFKNHRLYLRCINQAKVFDFFSKDKKQNYSEPVSQLSLLDIEWLAAVNRWPQLRALLDSKDEYFWQKVQEHITNDVRKTPNPEILELLKQPGLREFLTDSSVLGNIHNETSLQERFARYEATLEKMKLIGL